MFSDRHRKNDDEKAVCYFGYLFGYACRVVDGLKAGDVVGDPQASYGDGDRIRIMGRKMILLNCSNRLSIAKSNKMRSFLTMLGIVMGVFSVIAIMALGMQQNYIVGEFEKSEPIHIIFTIRVILLRTSGLPQGHQSAEENIPEIKTLQHLIKGSGN